MPPVERYLFGGFVLDVPERRLLRDERGVSLRPKDYDVLVALVRRAGRLVPKNELLETVWRGAFVEEGIVSVHIAALRKALGDTARPWRYIETVSRAGYRFVAPVEAGKLPRRNARTSPEVHELCGKGRTHLLSGSMFELPQAIEAFQGAVDLDPSYAPAHAGMALALCTQAMIAMRIAPTHDAYRLAKDAALRALALDDASADAQVALGTVLFFSEWEWEAAERSLRRALEINPAHVQGCVNYGRLLDVLGRHEEALDSKLRALEADPRSALVHLAIAWWHWNQRSYDEAIAWAERALDIDPGHSIAGEFLAGAYLKKGDVDRHVAAVVRHAQAHGLPAEALTPMKNAYASGGRAGLTAFAIEQLTTRSTEAVAVMLAMLYAEAGDLDAAFLNLDRAIDGRDPILVELAVGPQFDALRSDPRFDACLTRMRLPARAH
jgi:DNA-binding winged helix-turn-helix (wHTH) protein/Tfp pilus assembly protein PilF